MSPTMLSSEPVTMYGSAPAPALLETLQDALVSERRLLDDLIAQMRRQRAAVGTDDIQGVDDSTFATHRILATLGQARQRRRQLNVLLCGNEDASLIQLEEFLGAQMNERLRESRQRLQHAADLLAREVGMNRKLLREALTANDKHVRTLCGAPDHESTYSGESAPNRPHTPARGLLVNRTV